MRRRIARFFFVILLGTVAMVLGRGDLDDPDAARAGPARALGVAASSTGS